MAVFVAHRKYGVARILTYAAAGSTAIALICAALNLLEPAAYFIAGAGASLCLRLLLWLYRRLPESDRSGILSKRVVCRASLLSLIAAVGVSSAYWYLPWWLRVGYVPSAFLADHWRNLDFVPALFAQALPASWRSGFHQYFRDGWTYCFPGPSWWESMRYLRAAIPDFIAFLLGSFIMRLGAATTRRLRRSLPNA